MAKGVRSGMKEGTRQLSQPPLVKNTACKVCRSRKIRCDGKKPVCGTCYRTAISRGIHPKDMNCTWPFEGEEDEDMRAKEDKIRTLEQRVQSLQEILHSNEELIRSYQDAQQHQTNLSGTPQRATGLGKGNGNGEGEGGDAYARGLSVLAFTPLVP
ncbi:hypothetical protein BT69DRAFT_1353773 [Atractiella rhizophila]|nr:hypothetical protein BT69DRAFT_1353773 [Atractiella rhizophila]